jgi:hypothetical protein
MNGAASSTAIAIAAVRNPAHAHREYFARGCRRREDEIEIGA